MAPVLTSSEREREAWSFVYRKRVTMLEALHPKITSFVGGIDGQWQVTSVKPVTGDTLSQPPCLSIVEGYVEAADAAWVLRSFRSNHRYTYASEKARLEARQEGLGRPQATRPALIPITKSAEWWELPQDARRRIFEEDSGHIRKGLEYLPEIARRLYHSRDIGEPFDFLTWFEYAPEHAEAFEHLCDVLRATREWEYVVREVDIRLSAR